MCRGVNVGSVNQDEDTEEDAPEEVEEAPDPKSFIALRL